jgi:SAM-dependent methyltransferase
VFRTTAHLYDLIYGAKDYAAESVELHTLIQARCPRARSLLDVACGTGAHLAHLRDWYDVAGVDLDPGMLACAHQRLPGVPLHQGDMESFSLGRRFDALTCLFSSIGYLASTTDLNKTLVNFSSHLVPGGIVVIDGWVRPERWREPGTVHVESVENEELKLVRMSRTERDGAMTHLEMHYLAASLERIDHLVDHHHLRLFAPVEYESAMAMAGLTVEVLQSPLPDRDRYVGVKGR